MKELKAVVFRKDVLEYPDALTDSTFCHFRQIKFRILI